MKEGLNWFIFLFLWQVKFHIEPWGSRGLHTSGCRQGECSSFLQRVTLVDVVSLVFCIVAFEADMFHYVFAIFPQTRLMNQRKLKPSPADISGTAVCTSRVYTSALDCMVQVCVCVLF